MAEVRLEGVHKVYNEGGKNEYHAVKDVNLEIADKEFVVLVGPSGCGKTTTLRMIAGLEDISRGSITIGDRKVNDVPPKDRDIAMVFQNYALYPHMTVRKNLAFGLKLRKTPKEIIDQRVMQAAKMLGLESRLEAKPKELSGGQRQRVAVGRAIVRDPKAFLFDEPLSNLDAKLRVQMRAEISRLHTRLEATMIYVTHDQVEAMTMGDRIVVMKDGIVQQVADPITLYDNPVNKFVAGFIGSPPMNFMTGRLEGGKKGKLSFTDKPAGDDKAPGLTLPVPDEMKEKLEAYKDKPIIFGLRPEDIFDPERSSGEKKGTLIKSKVEVVEPMGSETYLYLTSGATPFIARVDAHTTAEVDAEREFGFVVENGHFFDAETEKTLC
jgi:multiple sugar transport system ATP-binding protein